MNTTAVREREGPEDVPDRWRVVASMLEQLHRMLLQAGHTNLALVIYAISLTLVVASVVGVATQRLCCSRSGGGGSGRPLQDATISSTTRRFVRGSARALPPTPPPPPHTLAMHISTPMNAVGVPPGATYDLPAPPSPATLGRMSHPPHRRRHESDLFTVEEVRLSTSSSGGEEEEGMYLTPLQDYTRTSHERKKSKRK